MEEKKQELAKRETPPSFIEKLMLNSESLEQIKEVGMVIIKSGFCPDHFKTNNDAVGIVMCIEAGRQLGLTWMQSLSDIYPVKGRTGIMGSAARSLIFSSGILDKWEELTEGTYPEDTYKHIIISKRKGLPGEFRSEFSVRDAKSAGLFTKDIYQRYGKRMIMWRNVGFHANDYYGDIMKGMKTVEELSDFDVIPGLGDTTLEKEDGTKLNITGGGKVRSGKMTERVAEKIPDNKFGAVSTTIADAVVIESETEAPENNEESPFVAEKGTVEYMDGKVITREGEVVQDDSPVHENQWTLKQMEEMDTKILLAKVNSDMDMMEACEMIPGKNTNKKLREIIDAWQRNDLTAYVAPYMKEGAQGPDEAENTTDADAEQAKSAGEIPVNKGFDQAKAEKEADDFLNAPAKQNGGVSIVNKYGIEIVDIELGKAREFSSVKGLFNALLKISPALDNAKYTELATKMGYIQLYPDRETFLRNAPSKEINLLLNEN